MRSERGPREAIEAAEVPAGHVRQLEHQMAELQAVNRDLLDLLVSSDIATLLLDTDLRIRRFTPATRSLIPLVPGDVGRTLFDVAFKLSDGTLLDDARLVLAQLIPREAEIRAPDGRWYLRRILLHRHRTGDRRLAGLVITFSDVSEIKASAERVRLRERQQAAVVELGQLALAGADSRALMARAVRSLAEVLEVDFGLVLALAGDARSFELRAAVGLDPGLAGGALPGLGYDSQAGYTLLTDGPVIVEDLRTERRFRPCELLVDHGVRSGLSVVIEGGRRPFGVLGAHARRRLAFSRDDVHFLQAVANVLSEALEHKRYTEAIAAGQQRLMLALAGGRMGAWDADINGRELIWTDRMFELLGYLPGAIEPTLPAFFGRVHRDDRKRVGLELERALGSRRRFSTEFRVRMPDGTLRWLVAIGRMLTEGAGRGSRMYGVAYDATERKETELTLVHRQRELAELSEQLEQRVAERTALAEQRAEKLSALAAELTFAEQRERIRLARRLHDEHQQLLVATKMRLERLRHDPTGGDPTARLDQAIVLLKQGIDQVRALALDLQPPVLQHGGLEQALRWLARDMHEKHGLEVELIGDDGAPTCDEEQLRLALFDVARELLLNVVKHAGVRSARVGLGGQASRLVLRIEDDGVGFEAAEALSPEGRGFGLLSIRERIDALGGRLDVHSAPGQGARFEVTVPVGSATGAERGAAIRARPGRRARRPDDGPLRLLVADDHRLVREGLLALLSHQPDMQVVGEAADGREAVRRYEELDPDVVIMDVAMPGLSGIEATRRIKARRPEARVVCLSLHEGEELQASLERAGADAFVHKSLTVDKLVETIRRVVNPED